MMQELEKSKPVILTGDLNCAHQEIDIYNPAVSDIDVNALYGIFNCPELLFVFYILNPKNLGYVSHICSLEPQWGG